MKEDKQLIQRIKQGSEDALTELVDKYYEQIFHYSYRILGSYEEAGDATQDILISMMKALPNYKERYKFKSWLFTIAHNRCINGYHVLKRNHSELVSEKKVSIYKDFAESYVEKKFVKELLDTLPEIQKSALILKYYHGLTAKEIAKITGVTSSTVKSRLRQGLQKLKKVIREGSKYEKQ